MSPSPELPGSAPARVSWQPSRQFLGSAACLHFFHAGSVGRGCRILLSIPQLGIAPGDAGTGWGQAAAPEAEYWESRIRPPSPGGTNSMCRHSTGKQEQGFPHCTSGAKEGLFMELAWGQPQQIKETEAQAEQQKG